MSLFTDIQHRTRDDAGCAVWKYSCCNGHPAMRKNKKTILVRRAIWTDAHGTIPDGKIIRMTCETPKCIHPEHMELTTFKRLAKELGAIGMMSGLTRSAKIAETKRKHYAKLTQSQVDEIRSCNETGVSLSKRLGISENSISKVRLSKTWKQFSNPFAGLMR